MFCSFQKQASFPEYRYTLRPQVAIPLGHRRALAIQNPNSSLLAIFLLPRHEMDGQNVQALFLKIEA
jgi:hypothetical protein